MPKGVEQQTTFCESEESKLECAIFICKILINLLNIDLCFVNSQICEQFIGETLAIDTASEAMQVCSRFNGF